MKIRERLQGVEEVLAGGRFDNDLPSITTVSTFMEGGGWWRKGKFWIGRESLIDLLDFFERSFFGFVGDFEFGEIGKRREMTALTLTERILSKASKVCGQRGLDDWVIRLIGLEDDAGASEVAAPDATDDLGEELKSALFGREIGQGQPCVGLDNANGREVGKIEAAS